MKITLKQLKQLIKEQLEETRFSDVELEDLRVDIKQFENLRKTLEEKKEELEAMPNKSGFVSRAIQEINDALSGRELPKFTSAQDRALEREYADTSPGYGEGGKRIRPRNEYGERDDEY
jgi:hypothetical protein